MSKKPPPPLSRRNNQRPPDRVNLASTFASKQRKDVAEQLDPSVYDYDAVYDSLHVQPKNVQKTLGPKYMKNLLKAADLRKRDQLQAKDKLLVREREAEGDQYAGKEKFVTSAYKAQQEVMRRLAEEEKRMEEEAAERRKKAGGGMTGLYNNLLERESDRHAAIAKAIQEGGSSTETDSISKEFEDQSKIAKDNGATVNEDGQIVDRRQLLKAGLNIASRSKLAREATHGALPAVERSYSSAVPPKADGAAMRERQTRMIELQLEQTTKRAAENQQIAVEALQRATKSRKTHEEVSSARERYLQRKQTKMSAATSG